MQLKISYCPERLEIRPQTLNNLIAHYFKLLAERLEKFVSTKT